VQKKSHRPRLWWCPTGDLAELPLHAAGIYDGPKSNQDCTAEYVVSSYTPTLSALRTARQGATRQVRTCTGSSVLNPDDHDNTQDTQTGVFVIAQSDVPGLPRLANAIVEARTIERVLSAKLPKSSVVLTVREDHVPLSTILEIIKSTTTNVVHLACHAQQAPDDPLDSGFSLYNGRLTLEDLMELRDSDADLRPHAQLAYLSACDSAAVDENQPDESLNLASAMLFAGFKSVIATMWSVKTCDRTR
jgi:CHAT domain-containing protein